MKWNAGSANQTYPRQRQRRHARGWGEREKRAGRVREPKRDQDDDDDDGGDDDDGDDDG